MSTETLDNTIKVKLGKRIYKKHKYYIPIIKERDKIFLTGQDLPYDKMIGKESLTDKEKEKYPIVVDPTGFYTVFDGQTLNRDNPTDKVYLNLMDISGKIAPTKEEYEKNKVKYDGWLEDQIAEAKFYNVKEDKRYEAETLIRNSPISEWRRISLIVNYTMNKNINVDTMPEDYIKAELLKAVNEDPEAVLNCFPKHNPGIEQDIYILELIKEKVLSRRVNGEIYDGDAFIGSNLTGAKNFMTLKANAGHIDKWKHALEVAKGNASDKAINSLSIMDQRANKYKETLNTIKVAITDDKVELAVFHYNKLSDEFGDLLDDSTRDFLLGKINGLKAKKDESKEVAKKEQFIKELNDLSVEELQRKIRNGKTLYKEKDCKEFFEDKEQLIEYIVKIKFPE